MVQKALLILKVVNVPVQSGLHIVNVPVLSAIAQEHVAIDPRILMIHMVFTTLISF